jgi:serine/threonine protein kinase SCH9
MQDQIGSSSPTPSGIETPRPDFHDKRTPGIMSNYFGQVGRYSSQSSPLRNTQAVATPAVDLGVASHPPLHMRRKSRRASESSLGSMVMVEREQDNRPSTPPPDETEARQESAHKSPESDPRMPPTPISSAASVIQRDGDSAENGMPLADSGIASITQALRNFVLPKSSFGGKARRHQSLPVSSVTKNSVSAAHISNPAATCPSSRTSPQDSPAPNSPTPPQPIPEASELTLDVADGPREKQTPPHTPRALSQEDRQRSPLASQAQTGAVPGKQVKAPHIPTSSPRGKLAVRIAEGKNLKPSYDPYVVCVFEYNEYISKGPRHDKMDVDGDESKPANPRLESIPIRRTDSDMGRPMAIPMRSRQSSTNGMPEEGVQLQKVVDPQWDHEATL